MSNMHASDPQEMPVEYCHHLRRRSPRRGRARTAQFEAEREALMEDENLQGGEYLKNNN